MKCGQNLVNILSLIVTFIKITNGDVCYGAEFAEDVTSCSDFTNELLKCDSLHLGMVEGKEAELGLSGVVEVTSDIVEGSTMGVEIWKILDIGKEFLYHMEGDICSNLQNKEAPWYPMIKSMNIVDCPIVKDSYDIKDMSINLNDSKAMMSHELIGDYIMQLHMHKGLEKLSCYEVGITVTEYGC